MLTVPINEVFMLVGGAHIEAVSLLQGLAFESERCLHRGASVTSRHKEARPTKNGRQLF